MPSSGAEPGERYVIITTSDHIPDTIPGAPLLLVEPHRIPESTLNFLIDYAPDTLYVLDFGSDTVGDHLASFGTVVPVSPDQLPYLEGKSLALDGYVILSDPDDPLYEAARILQKYRNCPLLTVPAELKVEMRQEWKFMQWELLGSLWGVWEYALWNTSEDTLQWIGYRYLFTDNLFATHDFRMRMKNDERVPSFLPGTTRYIAIVGDIGTSMEYWAQGLDTHHILVPTLTGNCDPQDYLCYRCDYSDFHRSYVEYSSVECFAPVNAVNDVLFQDAPKYWISSEKEREDLVSMASSYVDMMPAPDIPLTLDYILAETYAVGRFTGYDLADTVAFISRSLFLPPKSDTALLVNNIEVPLYTDAVLSLCEAAGIEVAHYPVGKAEASLLKDVQDTGLFIYNGTGNSSFFLPHFYKMGEGVATSLNMETEGIEPRTFILFPGNGCISFWFPHLTNTYDITIAEGTSGRVWKFTAARPELFVLVSDARGLETGLKKTDIDTIVTDALPDIDHFRSPFAYISATGPVGSSEFPLWFIRKGAGGFCINVGMQEVLTNFELEGLFFSRALAQFPVGDALQYAKNTVHTAGYWYPLSGLWMSEEQHVREEATCLFGDPALVLTPPYPVGSVSPDDLFCDPLQEARHLLDDIKETQVVCSQLGISLDAIETIVGEAEKRIDEGDATVNDYLLEEHARLQEELDALCQSQLTHIEEMVKEPGKASDLLALAQRAYAENRYVDCLVLCSQIQPESPFPPSLFWILGIIICAGAGGIIYSRWRS